MNRSPLPLRGAFLAAPLLLLAWWGGSPAPAPDVAADTSSQGPLYGTASAHPAPADSEAWRTDPRIDAALLLREMSLLAHDSMEGRRTGTEGNARARRFLLREFDRIGLEPAGGNRSQSFQVVVPGSQDVTFEGVNVVGLVEGRREPDLHLVVTAHFDHLGVRDGEIYNGADDNASGTAALLALARHFVENPPDHSILFVAMDAEELGLQGARAFLNDPPVPLDHVVMNVNMDMVSRSESGELWAAGTHHYPFLEPLVDEVVLEARVTLLKGHDSPDLPPGDDWTMASDHGPFHERGIPFIYFGVEDHPGYHDPTDTFENITPDFYVAAVETILDFVLVADREAATAFENRHAAPAGPKHEH